jgi:hypothetical protein
MGLSLVIAGCKLTTYLWKKMWKSSSACEPYGVSLATVIPFRECLKITCTFQASYHAMLLEVIFLWHFSNQA